MEEFNDNYALLIMKQGVIMWAIFALLPYIHMMNIIVVFIFTAAYGLLFFFLIQGMVV